MRRLHRVVVAVALIGACSEPRRAAPSAGSSAAPTPAATTARAAAAPTPKPPKHLGTLDLTAVVPQLPAVPGAVELSAPRLVMAGRQLQQDHCLAAPTLDAAAASVRDAMAAAAWTDVRERGRDPRIGLSATRGELQLSVAVSPSPRVGCDPTKQQWLLSTMVHAPATAAAAGAAALGAATADGAQVIH